MDSIRKSILELEDGQSIKIRAREGTIRNTASVANRLAGKKISVSILEDGSFLVTNNTSKK